MKRRAALNVTSIALSLSFALPAFAGDMFPPKLVTYEDARGAAQEIPPAEVGSGVSFVFTIEDPALDYPDYYDDVERVAQAAADAWTQHLDGDASIEVRVFFNRGDGTYIMAAGPILVQTGETVNGAAVWQAGPIWEIRGNGDANGGSADADLYISPDYIENLHWGYPEPAPSNQVDAFDTLQHELGHILGFIHLEEYYTGDGSTATSYDVQTRPLSVGHEYAGDQTIDTYGSAVPLADTEFDADRSHVGLASGDGSLMYPFAYPGERHDITNIELSILADAGMPIICLGEGEEGDSDSDGDGVLDCQDNCQQTANADQTDTDGDDVGDACDACPEDEGKSVEAGICGCGTPDLDSDNDGVYNCDDGCPIDANKTEPGECGCGTADTDGDEDGTPNCLDRCPIDPEKTEPGSCGCGTADTDSDGDGTSDCNDGCPNDPDSIAPGTTGCNPTTSGGDSGTGDNSAGGDDNEFLTLEDGDGAGGTCGAGAVVMFPVLLLSLSAMRLVSRRRR